jgi:hypothetical protein
MLSQIPESNPQEPFMSQDNLQQIQPGQQPAPVPSPTSTSEQVTEEQIQALIKTAEESGIDEGDLDDVILDDFMAQASAVNNQGVPGQIRYLLENNSLEVVTRDLLKIKETTRVVTGLCAVIFQDDRDSHGEGCDCGDCNSQGIAYGAAIYVIPEGTSLDGLDAATIQQYDPLERVEGPSPEAATANACALCNHREIRVITL